ncbi:MAG: hypothetical protein ACI4UE_01190 [Candidatus Scatovivens sp.]
MEKEAVIKKIIFVSAILIIITLTIFSIIKYQVEGEKTLPYEIEKILITSNIEGDVIEGTDDLWAINISQPNDIYIYINQKEETKIAISSILIDNFKINNAPQKGTIKILRPTGELKNLYKYSEQDYMDSSIEYIGGNIDDLKKLQINNGGGILGFRVKLENLGEYISNEDTEIVYDGTLLTKAGVTIDQIKNNISFDLTIKTSDNISYKTTVSLDLPVGNILEEGSSSIEIYNLNNLVFKRV